MILRDLLSLSTEFEVGIRRPCEEPPAVAALRFLGGLEAIARASLTNRFAMTAPATAKVQTARATPAPGRIAIPPAPAAPTLWSTRSKTYRPALGDPSVIEALLKFRDQAPPIDASSNAPRASTRASGASAAVLPPAPVPTRRNELASPFEIQPARLERLSAEDLEPCFPFEPSSKLLRPRQ